MRLITTLPAGLPVWNRHSLGRLMLLCAAVLWVCSAACAGQKSITLIVGGRPVLFEASPYQNRDGLIYAPAEFVRTIGADFSVNSDQTLTITAYTGKRLTVPFTQVKDRLMIPVQSTATALGANTEWDPRSLSLSLKAKLLMARIDNGNLVIVTSYPIYYKTTTLDNPDRLFVDIFGTDLGTLPAEIPADGNNVSRIRTGQLDPNTVRLVLDLDHPINFQVASTLQTSSIRLALNTTHTENTYVPSIGGQAYNSDVDQGRSSDTASADSGDSTPTNPDSTGSTPNGLVLLPQIEGSSTNNPPVVAPLSGVRIVGVDYKQVDAYVSQLIITTQGRVDPSQPPYRSAFLNDPSRFTFDIPGATLDIPQQASDDGQNQLTVDNPLFNVVRWGLVQSGVLSAGRIVVDLLHPIVYNVASENLADNSGVRYIIDIQQGDTQTVADATSNSIKGKIIVVDPGHGGKDSGAPGRGVYEKNFTLAIGKQLRDILIQDGAKVIMTRADDTFIPLEERAAMGVAAHADYFVSIHCDSSGYQNAHSGATVYYHGNDPVARLMAHSIASRLAQSNTGIPSDGIRSDYVRFPGIGFSVLRNSTEPAVLVECGYVNDDNDAQSLGDPQSQQAIAASIVAGLKDYTANR